MIELLLTAFGAVIGYFGRRFIEKTGRTEEIERKAKLLELHERMTQANVSVEALTSFEDELLRKTHRLRTIEDRLLPQPTDLELDGYRVAEVEEESDLETQAEMTERASTRFAHTQLELSTEIRAAHEMLDGDQLAKFNEAHQQWINYRDKQAALAASFYEGGTLQPMAHLSEMERLTISRIAEIQDFIEMHKEMVG